MAEHIDMFMQCRIYSRIFREIPLPSWVTFLGPQEPPHTAQLLYTPKMSINRKSQGSMMELIQQANQAPKTRGKASERLKNNPLSAARRTLSSKVVRTQKSLAQKYEQKLDDFKEKQIEGGKGLLDGEAMFDKDKLNPTEAQIAAHKADMERKQLERVTNMVFLEFVKKQKAQRESCLTLPFTCLLWLVFLLVIVCHSPIDISYVTRTGVLQDMQRIEILAEDPVGFAANAYARRRSLHGNTHEKKRDDMSPVGFGFENKMISWEASIRKTPVRSRLTRTFDKLHRAKAKAEERRASEKEKTRKAKAERLLNGADLYYDPQTGKNVLKFGKKSRRLTAAETTTAAASDASAPSATGAAVTTAAPASAPQPSSYVVSAEHLQWRSTVARLLKQSQGRDCAMRAAVRPRSSKIRSIFGHYHLV